MYPLVRDRRVSQRQDWVVMRDWQCTLAPEECRVLLWYITCLWSCLSLQTSPCHRWCYVQNLYASMVLLAERWSYRKWVISQLGSAQPRKLKHVLGTVSRFSPQGQFLHGPFFLDWDLSRECNCPRKFRFSTRMRFGAHFLCRIQIPLRIPLCCLVIVNKLLIRQSQLLWITFKNVIKTRQ